MANEGNSVLERLGFVQAFLKAPKGQRNTFGNYNYRSCEDILEAVKPLLADQRLTLTITDALENIGDRYYIKATAAVSPYDGTGTIVAEGYAREEETKKGMDGSQITGAAASYARKYALNGLFLIDDTKDSDHTNQGPAKKPMYAKTEPKTEPVVQPAKVETQAKLGGAIKLKGITDKQKIVNILDNLSASNFEVPSFMSLSENEARELLITVNKTHKDALEMITGGQMA